MSGATEKFINQKLKQWPVCVFSKKSDSACLRAKQILMLYEQYMPYNTCEYVEIEKRQDCTSIENYLLKLSLNDSRMVRNYIKLNSCFNSFNLYFSFFVLIIGATSIFTWKVFWQLI